MAITSTICATTSVFFRAIVTHVPYVFLPRKVTWNFPDYKKKKTIKRYNAPLISRQTTISLQTISISRIRGCAVYPLQETYLHIVGYVLLCCYDDYIPPFLPVT